MLSSKSLPRLSVILFCSVLLIACGDLSKNVTSIRIAHGLDTGHPVHQALVFFNKRLSEISSGAMELVIYPSGQLGSEREIIELVQIGSMGMTKVSASSLEAFVPQMKLFSLPYLFNDQTHLWEVLNGEVGQQLLDAGTPFLVKGLGYFDSGSRSFYSTKKEIEQPSDLAGMKIRVMNSQSAVNMVNTMGGAATPVSWGELYTALQQGIVEGAENNPPSFYYSKHYEVSKFYILDEHTSIPDVIIIGTHLWNNLTATQQAWLTQAMKEASDYQRILWQESTEMALSEVKAAGVKIITADKSVFKDSVAPIYEKINNTELAPLVQQVKAMGEKL